MAEHLDYREFPVVCQHLNDFDSEYYSMSHDNRPPFKELHGQKVAYALTLSGLERDFAFQWIRKQ